MELVFIAASEEAEVSCWNWDRGEGWLLCLFCDEHLFISSTDRRTEGKLRCLAFKKLFVSISIWT